MSKGLNNFDKSANDLPPVALKERLPLFAMKILFGATMDYNYKGQTSALVLGDDAILCSRSDYDKALYIAQKLSGEYNSGCISPNEVLRLYGLAEGISDKLSDGRIGKLSVCMIKGRGAAGYWRCNLPSTVLGSDEIWCDVTDSEVEVDSLVEYDTVMVQRTDDWRSFYVLKRLKEAGVRVVYDIDDDIYNITPDNPAYSYIGWDNQTCAAACMDLADAVVVTTEILKSRISQVVEDPSKIVVIPNAMDTHDNWSSKRISSIDGKKRIFWQGSSTHDEDWNECIGGLDILMAKHENIVLSIMGSLPKCVQSRIESGAWINRVEYVGFSDPETYYNLVRSVQADVGIAPLRSTLFNQSKSPIKWLEMTCMGVPVVASDVSPYREVITKGNGWLAGSVEEWVEGIESAMGLQGTRRWTQSRSDISKFDLTSVVESWQDVLWSGLGEAQYGVAKEDTTCWDCDDNKTCKFAWDTYNTDGDCLRK